MRNNKWILSATLIASVIVTGCGKSGGKNSIIPGVTGPVISHVNNAFMLTMTFKDLKLDQGLRIPIDHTDNSYIELSPSLDTQGSIFAVSLADADVLKLSGTSLLPADALPGGRPLPGIPTGILPAVAVSVNSVEWLKHSVFYFGKDIFAIWVPVALPFDQLVLTSRFYSSQGAQVGDMSLVGRDTDRKNSGVFLAINSAKGTVVGKILKK
jgi:hypothetical protein